MPKRLSTEYVRDFFKNIGYTLLTEIYKNARQTLEVSCENGHINKVTFSRLGYKNQKCHVCVSEASKFTIEYVRHVFENEGYKLISDSYEGAGQKLEVACPNGHLWFTTLNKFKDSERRCPECSFLGGTSRLERELFLIVKEHFPSTKKSKHRHLKIAGKPHVKGFDIDIYVPELKKGIEFDGTYFHSIPGLLRGYPNWPLKDLKNYHKIKDSYFKSKGIDILHVKEENWNGDKEKCVKEVLLFLGKL